MTATATTLPTKAEVTLTRTFDAPRDLVFRMWIEPQHLAKWWGPKSFTNPRCEVDARPGGKMHIDMTGPDGTVYPMTGEFREIVRPERLVFTTRALDRDGKVLLEGTSAVTFTEQGGKTIVHLRSTAVSTSEIGPQMLAGMKEGWTQSIDKLGDLVTQLAARRGEMQMQTITPFLWFDDKAGEAMEFYVSVFKGARIVRQQRGKDGKVMSGTFELGGREYHAFNGGPMFKFSPAISLFVNCETQAEIDELWDKLSAGGGEPQRCGWVKDKYGLSWQIIPSVLGRGLQDPDPAKSSRVMQAMLGMHKIDVAGIETACAG